MKRQRGRGRKPGGGGGYHPNQQHHPNRTIESSGPDVKVRGPASHVYERYLQLARDAASSGDRVLSENYLQHADHYFRLVRQMQPALPPQQADRFNGDGEHEGDDDAGAEAERADMEAASEGDDQPEAEFAQGDAAPQPDRGEGDFRRRRGRRNRFRPGAGEGEGAEPRQARDEGGEQRGDRPERYERRERAPREQNETQEGFAVGPKPAFLRTE